jgi:hypothetical protein
MFTKFKIKTNNQIIEFVAGEMAPGSWGFFIEEK